MSLLMLIILFIGLASACRRYEREVNLTQRSCLKKIMEHDETASRTMVLCVAAIVTSPIAKSHMGAGVAGQQERQQVHLELTDGWYWVRGMLDQPLRRLLDNGQLHTGDKLRVSGSELMSDRPADPLEACSFAALRLHANGTHK
jgi:breast cancer 2 susceptibility protein